MLSVLVGQSLGPGLVLGGKFVFPIFLSLLHVNNLNVCNKRSEHNFILTMTPTLCLSVCVSVCLCLSVGRCVIIRGLEEVTTIQHDNHMPMCAYSTVIIEFKVHTVHTLYTK